MEATITAERKESLLRELRTRRKCTKWQLLSNWKAFIFMQSVTSWQKFSAQTHRFEHHCETNAPPHTPDS